MNKKDRVEEGQGAPSKSRLLSDHWPDRRSAFNRADAEIEVKREIKSSKHVEDHQPSEHGCRADMRGTPVTGTR